MAQPYSIPVQVDFERAQSWDKDQILGRLFDLQRALEEQIALSSSLATKNEALNREIVEMKLAFADSALANFRQSSLAKPTQSNPRSYADIVSGGYSIGGNATLVAKLPTAAQGQKFDPASMNLLLSSSDSDVPVVEPRWDREVRRCFR